MKPFSLLSLGCALTLSTFANAQIIAGIQPADVAEAMEVQPALDAPQAELVEAEALACLAKGSRETITYDRYAKKVNFAFTMKNLDLKRTLLAGFVVRSIYTRPAMNDGPEVDSASFRVRLGAGETKTFYGQLNWDAPEGSVPRLVLPDPLVHAEQVLRAQFEATPVLQAQAADEPIPATPELIDAAAYGGLSIGRQSVTWNRRDRTVSFTIVLRNNDAKYELSVGGAVKTMSTRPQSPTGPETDGMGFRVRIPAGETRVISGTLAWDDLGGAAVPRIALPDKQLHKELILKAQFEGLVLNP
ncbi:MAG: hypothetical protein HZA53_13615 [Planctomycetes bacterium]|nr:hypothetical protein [Planctomycetota bacterium]